MILTRRLNSGSSLNSKTGKKKRILRNTWPFILAGLFIVGVRLAIKKPEIVESCYSNGLYPFIAKVFSSVSKLVPFSLWDIFWVLIILLFITGLILALLRKVRGWWFVLRVFQLIALIYSFFYFSWGFNYFRLPIEKRNSWVMVPANEVIFRDILDSLIVYTNRCYVQIPDTGLKVFDELVEESYRNNSKELRLNYPNGSRNPKRMVFSSYFSKSGISGYFGPFFNEVHLNNYVVPFDYPFLLSHEKAHQFGIASEAEANLAAFVICSSSVDIRLRYSGYLNILLYFLNDASHLKDYNSYITKIDMHVIDDIRFRFRYYNGLQNKTLEKVQTAANNAYLKSNNIKKGVENYNQVVSLIIDWYHN